MLVSRPVIKHEDVRAATFICKVWELDRTGKEWFLKPNLHRYMYIFKKY